MDDISESGINEELLLELPEIEDIEGGEKLAYGCIFCRTGSERVIAYCLRRYFGCTDAIYVKQIKHKSVDGKRSDEIKTAIPGYVFFTAGESREITGSKARVMKDVFKLLTGQKGEWQLEGADAEFAEKVMKSGGMWGVSKAQVLGGRVHIISGPLKDYEGNIVKIDRRNRNGLIEISFGGRAFKVWLAFDLTEEVSGGEQVKERDK